MQPEINAPQEYGGKGCKLPELSLDGRYLAYVAISRQGSGNDIFFADSVRILDAGQEREVHIVRKMNYIVSLDWSPTGELIFWEQIWEGPMVVFIYDPAQDLIVAKMRQNQGAALHWNSPHTAFFAVHVGEYGAESCVSELGGYDFQYRNSFPDLHGIFKLRTRTDDFFGIPYGFEDNLRIQPFAWSKDGKRLWLEVTPLYWKGIAIGRYEMGPRQAGALELASDGVVYRPLAADLRLDYSFDGLPDPKIFGQAYQPKLCP